MKKKIKKFIIIGTPFFLIIHFLGWFKFYYKLQFYDEIVHFLAGASVFLVFYWMLKNKFKNNLKATCLSLIGLLVISFLWESLEVLLDNILGNYFVIEPLQLGFLDTITDVIANFAGAVFIIIFLIFKSDFK